MRKLKAVMAKDDRVETEGLMINDDWPGFFLRGDDALYLASLISSLSVIGGYDQGMVSALKIYADQIFEEVPFTQWVDYAGRSIIQARKDEDVTVVEVPSLTDMISTGIYITPGGHVSMGIGEDDSEED